MKNVRSILIGELLIVSLMSLAAGYALLDALFFIPFSVLLAIGLITIMLPRNFVFVFSIIAGLITLPAFMKLNNVKWWLFTPDRLNFCPDLNLPAALGIGLLIICGGLILNCLQALRQEVRILNREQVENEQVQTYAAGQSLVVLGAVTGGGIIAAGMVAVLNLARTGLSNWFRNISWVLPVVGLLSLLILGLIVFWLAGSRHESVIKGRNDRV